MADPTTVGPYAVVRCLGRGGMGVVYECRHPALPRTVAVKQVHAHLAPAAALARFAREAEALARLRHPGVVAVHDLGQTPQGPYLVMDLVEGQPLDRLAQRGPLAPREAARLVAAMARAVEAIHAAGVLHRDLKPPNTILRPDGSPVLLDFGLAREVDAERMTRTGEVLGTLRYMSPEQADGRADLDGRADVYSLGAILYELLAGEPPWVEESGVQLLLRVLTGPDAAPPSALNPGVPPALDALVARAMAREREERCPSAAALAAELEGFLASEAPPAPPPARRGPLLAGVGLLLLALVVGGAVAARSAGAGLDAGPEAGSDISPDRTPAPSATPTATPTPSAAPSLWQVAPGQRLVYVLTYEEVAATQAITLTCTLALSAEKPREGLLGFACEVTRVQCSLGARATPGPSYDSRLRDPQHPLAMLGAGVGQPFQLRIELQTGAVQEVAGFDEIRARVLRQPHGSLSAFMSEAMLKRTIGGVFSDSFIKASMDALTNVEGGGRVVPWGAVPREAGRYRVAAEQRTCALRSLTTSFRPGDRFALEGSSRYAGGSVREAQLTQTLQRGEEPCRMEWSMRRE
ncbi:MAG: protein kinase [Planctomycetota bacterium]